MQKQIKTYLIYLPVVSYLSVSLVCLCRLFTQWTSVKAKHAFHFECTICLTKTAREKITMQVFKDTGCFLSWTKPIAMISLNTIIGAYLL